MKDKKDIENHLKILYNQMGKLENKFNIDYIKLDTWAKALQWVLDHK